MNGSLAKKAVFMSRPKVLIALCFLVFTHHVHAIGEAGFFAGKLVQAKMKGGRQENHFFLSLKSQSSTEHWWTRSLIEHDCVDFISLIEKKGQSESVSQKEQVAYLYDNFFKPKTSLGFLWCQQALFRVAPDYTKTDLENKLSKWIEKTYPGNKSDLDNRQAAFVPSLTSQNPYQWQVMKITIGKDENPRVYQVFILIDTMPRAAFDEQKQLLTLYARKQVIEKGPGTTENPVGRTLRNTAEKGSEPGTQYQLIKDRSVLQFRVLTDEELISTEDCAEFSRVLATGLKSIIHFYQQMATSEFLPRFLRDFLKDKQDTPYYFRSERDTPSRPSVILSYVHNDSLSSDLSFSKILQELGFINVHIPGKNGENIYSNGYFATSDNGIKEGSADHPRFVWWLDFLEHPLIPLDQLDESKIESNAVAEFINGFNHEDSILTERQ